MVHTTGVTGVYTCNPTVTSEMAIFHQLTTNALKPFATTAYVRAGIKKHPTCDVEIRLLSQE
jgi:hypothetical protein